VKTDCLICSKKEKQTKKLVLSITIRFVEIWLMLMMILKYYEENTILSLKVLLK
jgi:hypothetical protein